MARMSEEDLINETMGALDEPADLQLARLALPAMPMVESPTLAALPSVRLPEPVTVCQTCPNAMWQANEQDVSCYCRVMYVVVWSNKEPRHLTHCDGPWIGQEEKEKEE